jgi:hypothetical protein
MENEKEKKFVESHTTVIYRCANSRRWYSVPLSPQKLCTVRVFGRWTFSREDAPKPRICAEMTESINKMTGVRKKGAYYFGTEEVLYELL